MRGVVVGSQLDNSGKFLVGTIEVSKLEIGFPELIVGLGETGIDLHSIGKLNGRLAVLALAEIALAALKVLLFAHIGITRAAREQSSGKRTNKQQTDDPGTTHDHFSNCSAECADKFPALERSIILHENRQAKVTAVTAVSECIITEFSSARNVAVKQRSDITGKGKKALLCSFRRFAGIHGSRDPH